MSAEVETYRFTVEEFNKLGQAGIFDEDDRVELLDGEIIVMSPIGKQHAGTVMQLHSLLQGRLHPRVLPGVQNPAVIDEFSEPLPDIMLLKPKKDYYKSGHPQPKDILLLIEVSDTTLRYDRNRKLPKYAESGVPEVWIVNLKNQTIEQYRNPAAGEYLHCHVYQRGEQISVKAFPEVEFTVEELIG